MFKVWKEVSWNIWLCQQYTVACMNTNVILVFITGKGDPFRHLCWKYKIYTMLMSVIFCQRCQCICEVAIWIAISFQTLFLHPFRWQIIICFVLEIAVSKQDKRKQLNNFHMLGWWTLVSFQMVPRGIRRNSFVSLWFG